MTGHILDVYGGVINSIGLTIGLGFSLLINRTMKFLIYLIVVTACLNSEVFTSVGKKLILENLNKILFQTKTDNHVINGDNKEKILLIALGLNIQNG